MLLGSNIWWGSRPHVWGPRHQRHQGGTLLVMAKLPGDKKTNHGCPNRKELHTPRNGTRNPTSQWAAARGPTKDKAAPLLGDQQVGGQGLSRTQCPKDVDAPGPTAASLARRLSAGRLNVWPKDGIWGGRANMGKYVSLPPFHPPGGT